MATALGTRQALPHSTQTVKQALLFSTCLRLRNIITEKPSKILQQPGSSRFYLLPKLVTIPDLLC
ncbi:hypothetical protein I79_021748 [Cricetulus griseus]|uniref:Uncharacterized protein n=1 Tax=Cricetulus griseus TaxID=10029 RepID=G3IDG8_CRIGR|nr:hypothetical protein I79_021748 [Cricetulus griseus]